MPNWSLFVDQLAKKGFFENNSKIQLKIVQKVKQNIF